MRFTIIDITIPDFDLIAHTDWGLFSIYFEAAI